MNGLLEGRRVMTLTGAAGTGKTTMTKVIAFESVRLGWTVLYMAPTGKAARRISEITGSDAKTIHSMLYERVVENEDGEPTFHDIKTLCEPETLLICDEASMVNTELHRDIMAALPRGACLLYVGDREQLPPVVGTWGPDFDHPTAVLETIHRVAADNPIIQVATELRNGGSLPKEPIGETYDRRSGSLDQVAQWVTGLLEEGKDAAVITWANKSRQAINRLSRYNLGFRDLGPLVIGDRLLIMRNNKIAGRMNGEVVTVAKISSVMTDAYEDSELEPPLWITPTDGSPFVLHADYLGADYKELPGLYKDVCRRHSSVFNSRFFVMVDYGYSLTVHKSQGSEFDHVCFVIDWMTRKRAMKSHEDLAMVRKLFYTAVTRSKKNLLIWDA